MFEHKAVVEAVAGLVDTDPARLPDHDLIERLKDAAAVVAWAEHTGLVAVAELRTRRQAEYLESTGGRPNPRGAADGDEVDRFAAVEVAAALRISQRSALGRVSLADELLTRLPRTAEALACGVVGLGHARAMLDACAGAGVDLGRLVEERVLQRPERTPAELARACRRLVDAEDSAAAERRAGRANGARRVQSWALPDGMAALQVVGPAPAVAGVWARLDALARQAQQRVRQASRDTFGQVACDAATGDLGGDLTAGVPTLDQARVDAALRLLSGDPVAGQEAAPPVAVSVDVLVPLGTLAGLGGEPAELAGFGSLPDSVARALVRAASTVRIVPLALDGSVDDGCRHDTSAYRPSMRLAARVRARDLTCRFPGCSRRATGCDIDHTVPHPAGPTAPCNMACLCRTHHRVKHRAGWAVEQLGRGRLRWRSPTGHRYETEPPRWTRSPVFTGSAVFTGSPVPARDPALRSSGVEPAGP